MRHSNWIITQINNRRRDILALAAHEAAAANCVVADAVRQEREFLDTLNATELAWEWSCIPKQFQHTSDRNLGCA